LCDQLFVDCVGAGGELAGGLCVGEVSVSWERVVFAVSAGDADVVVDEAGVHNKTVVAQAKEQAASSK